VPVIAIVWQLMMQAVDAERLRHDGHVTLTVKEYSKLLTYEHMRLGYKEELT